MDVEKRKNEILKFVEPVIVYSNDENCPCEITGIIYRKEL
jgi:hypothetical protein